MECLLNPVMYGKLHAQKEHGYVLVIEWVECNYNLGTDAHNLSE